MIWMGLKTHRINRRDGDTILSYKFLASTKLTHCYEDRLKEYDEPELDQRSIPKKETAYGTVCPEISSSVECLFTTKAVSDSTSSTSSNHGKDNPLADFIFQARNRKDSENCIIYCHQLLHIVTKNKYSELRVKPGFEGYLMQHRNITGLYCFIQAETLVDMMERRSKYNKVKNLFVSPQVYSSAFIIGLLSLLTSYGGNILNREMWLLITRTISLRGILSLRLVPETLYW